MAKEQETTDPVYFLMPDGTKVSNDRRFDPDLEEDGGYSSMTSKELKEIVDARNQGRVEDDKIDLTGMKKKSELVAALEEDDEAQADPDAGNDES